MLSRIGNSLFWLGRFIERAEHIARYTKVQYLSSLDAPLAQDKDFVLESILHMAGVTQSYYTKFTQLTEEDVLNYIVLDEANTLSLVSQIGFIRENARGTRDNISLELWEAINRYYHTINGYNSNKLHSEGIHSFSEIVETNSSIIKGYIDNTLIHNETWMLINLGIHMERAIQVGRILFTKIKDIEKLDTSKSAGAQANYQLTTMLKSAESFDMFNRQYNTNINRRNSLDFLLFNSLFPKSIVYNLDVVRKNIESLDFNEQKGKGSIDFVVGKLAARYQFLTIEEVDSSIIDFLSETLSSVADVGRLLEEKYLAY
jgi:uncharacterized alpha-E superfamily protein